MGPLALALLPKNRTKMSKARTLTANASLVGERIFNDTPGADFSLSSARIRVALWGV